MYKKKTKSNSVIPRQTQKVIVDAPIPKDDQELSSGGVRGKNGELVEQYKNPRPFKELTSKRASAKKLGHSELVGGLIAGFCISHVVRSFVDEVLCVDSSENKVIYQTWEPQTGESDRPSEIESFENVIPFPIKKAV